MRPVDGLQSAIMYRTSKPLHGRANVFVLYPLIIIYVVSATLLLAAEGAKASTSQSDIKEAEKIVGRFIRTEAGSNWLAGLAKTKSAPLTTQVLMKEIIKATRPHGRVWQAALTLSEAFEDQTREGINAQSILAQTESWKDILEHIENQDDIICLYRKSTVETAKKSDEWNKFLRTVTPGYTVHLAIDTGSKYVICLKKIEVPETTPAEISSTSEAPTTPAPSEDPPVVTPTVPDSTTPEEPVTTSSLGSYRSTLNNESNVEHDYSDENCQDSSQDASGDCGDEDSNSRNDKSDELYGAADLTDNEYLLQRREMDHDSKAELERPVNFKQDRRALDPPSNKRSQVDSANDAWWPSVNSPAQMPGGISSGPSVDPECNRPIIVVMQNGNIPLAYHPIGPAGPSGMSGHRNLGVSKVPWIPSPPVPLAQAAHPRPPKLSIMNYLPRPVVYPPKIPAGSYRSFAPPNRYPRLPPNNPYRSMIDLRSTVHMAGPRQVVSHNSQVVYHSPRGKMQRPIAKSYLGAGVPIGQHPVRTIAKPVVQKFPNVFLPQPPRMKPQVYASDRQNDFFVNSMRYPFGSYMPRRDQGHPGPIFPKSGIHGPAKNTRLKVPVRNVALPQRPMTNEAYMGRNIRQFWQKYKYPRTSPRSFAPGGQPFAQKPGALTIGKLFPNLSNIGKPREPPRLPLQRIPRINPQFNYPSRRYPPVKSDFYQRPNYVLNPNYPSPYHLVQLTRPCPIHWIPPCATYLAHPLVRCGNPLVCPLAGYPHQCNSIPCQSPCEMPVKLQIVINGKIQEPLKVSVISQPGQRVEIVGSPNPTMPRGSRALITGIPLVDGLRDDKNNDQLEVQEVKQRMFEAEKDIRKYVDDEKMGNQTKEENKKVNAKVSSGKSVEDISEKSDDKHNPTTELKIDTTTESIKGLEIKERFLHEETTEKNSAVSATMENTTLSATTNSTIVE